MCRFLFSLPFSDSKITQWEDPRLQNPAITGPVSIPKFSLRSVILVGSEHAFLLVLWCDWS